VAQAAQRDGVPANTPGQAGWGSELLMEL